MTNKIWNAYYKKDIVQIDVETQPRKDWVFWVQLRSDAHWDNTKSDRRLQRKHLNKAKKRGACILDGGDLFCAMQGKGDPRSGKSAIRPEHNKSNYLDSLVDTAVKWHEPYKDYFAVAGTGNHEAAVFDRKETDLTQRFADGMGCLKMDISGFIRFHFKVKDSRQSFSYLMHFHHGYGGGGPVTKDVIQANRKAVYLNNADIVWSGHTHDAWWFPQSRLDVSKDGSILGRMQHHVKTPTYKDDYAKGKTRWANLKGMPPKLMGCMWLKFKWEHRKVKGKETQRRVNVSFEPDVSPPNPDHGWA